MSLSEYQVSNDDLLSAAILTGIVAGSQGRVGGGSRGG